MDEIRQPPAAALTPDRVKQKAIYDRIQDLVLSDAPRVMTVRPDVIWGVKKAFLLPRGVDSLQAFFGSIPRWQVR